MTTYHYSSTNAPNQPPRSQRFKAYFNEHRALVLILGVLVFTLIIVIISAIIMALIPDEPKQEVEEAPVLTYQNQNLIEQTVLGDNLTFHLNLIIMSNQEIMSAPTNNNNKRDYIATVDHSSYKRTTANNQNLYAMNINISDGRVYTLRILINIIYAEEYAIIVLDRTDSTDAQDYVVTFTNNTPEYYYTLGTSQASTAIDSSSIHDYLSGAPLLPLPDASTDWIDSLNLTNPITFTSSLPTLY